MGMTHSAYFFIDNMEQDLATKFNEEVFKRQLETLNEDQAKDLSLFFYRQNTIFRKLLITANKLLAQ